MNDVTTTTLLTTLGLLGLGYIVILLAALKQAAANRELVSQIMKLQRWRKNTDVYMSALCEFPQAYAALANLRAAAIGTETLSADATCHGPWTPGALRQILRSAEPGRLTCKS